MSTISFDLSRSSFDPGWDVDSGIHDALWIQYLQTYSYTANGNTSLLSGSTVPTQGVTFTAAQGDIVFRRMTFADRGGSIGSASATGAAVVTLDWTSSDSATLRLDRAWNTIKNAEVSNFGGTTLRVENFVDAWVHLADNTGRSITIEGSKRAEVSTGGGNDTITIGVESNNAGWTNEFIVDSGAGNDVIRYRATATNYVAGQYRGQWTTTTTRAGAGDDTIYGWGSDDIVDGGAGIDQFILSGRLSAYRITTVAGVTTVVGTSPCDGNDGRDRLVNVERIVDADGTVLLLGTSGAPLNAAPIAGDDTEFLTASGGVLGTVNLTAALLDNDVDPEGKALTITAVGPASLGTVTLASGVVQFSFGDPAYRALAEGQTAVASFSYTVADPDGLTDTALATITVTGVNDAATITGSSTGVVSEDGTLSATGSLAVSDADGGESLFSAPASLAGTYGNFSFTSSGLWGYTLSNGLSAVQSLGAGQSLTDSLTVASLDGTASRAITVTLNGVNDTATITGTSTGVVSEDGTLSAAGSLAVSDADAGESLFSAPTSLAGTYGNFSFTSSGLWGYTLSNGLSAVQSLRAGQSLTDSLTVASLDGTASRAITVTINGVNDALFTEGADWIDFNTVSSGTYTPGTDTDALGGNDTVVLLNSGNSLQTSSFTGGSGDDNISGSATAANQNGINILASTTLSGGAGNDTISGSANGINGRGINNSGTIQGDEGVDSIGGADLIIGNGPDGIFNLGMIRGDGGNDTITGATLPDNSPGIHNAGTISGGDGDDTISGTGYGSNVRGIFNSGLISGGAGNDTIQGSAVTGGDGIENTGTISGGDGNDVLIGSKTAALNSAIRNAGRIEMGAGEDIVDALQGGFFFVGTTGIIDMGADNDTLKGFGNGTHIGGSGTDRLVFGAGTGTYVVSNSGATWSIVRGSVTMSVSEFELISFNGGSTFSNLTAGSFIS